MSIIIVLLLFAGTAFFIRSKQSGRGAVLISISTIKPFLIASILILIAMVVFFFPKEAGRIITSKVTEIQEATSGATPAVDDYSQVTTTGSQPKVLTDHGKGMVVAGKVNKVKSVKGCTELIAETTFTPGPETLSNPPLLARVGPGKYLATAEGKRCQDIYAGGSYVPDHCEIRDPSGLDSNALQYISTNPEAKTMLPLPNLAWGYFFLEDGVEINPIGTISYITKTAPNSTLKMNLNLPKNPYSYTSGDKGSFVVKLYRCGE